MSSVNSPGYLASKKFAETQDKNGFDDNLQLVPCRWSNTGWKYVQADPSRTQFFQSPNRVNSFGFNHGTKKRTVTKSMNRQDFNPDESGF